MGKKSEYFPEGIESDEDTTDVDEECIKKEHKGKTYITIDLIRNLIENLLNLVSHVSRFCSTTNVYVDSSHLSVY